MKAKFSSEKSVGFQRTTRRYIPEGRTVQEKSRPKQQINTYDQKIIVILLYSKGINASSNLIYLTSKTRLWMKQRYDVLRRYK
jgi:hypothetical protein